MHALAAKHLISLPRVEAELSMPGCCLSHRPLAPIWVRKAASCLRDFSYVLDVTTGRLDLSNESPSLAVVGQHLLPHAIACHTSRTLQPHPLA